MKSTKKILIPWMTRERLRSVALAHALELPKLEATGLTDEQYHQAIAVLNPLAQQVEEVASLISELNYYRKYGED